MTFYWTAIVHIALLNLGHPRSFKMVPFESLGGVSYSPSIVTMEYPSSKYDVTLKTGFGVVQRHWNWRRSTIYDFLLDRYCTYSSLKSGSLKVIQNGTIRKLGCGFLFAFHSNYGAILHQFRDKARYWSKIVIFSTPLHSTPPYIYNRLGTIPACDRQTDGQTSSHGIVRAIHTCSAVTTICYVERGCLSPWYSAYPCKISLKLDNRLLRYGQNNFQYGSRPPS